MNVPLYLMKATDAEILYQLLLTTNVISKLILMVVHIERKKPFLYLIHSNICHLILLVNVNENVYCASVAKELRL